MQSESAHEFEVQLSPFRAPRGSQTGASTEAVSLPSAQAVGAGPPAFRRLFPVTRPPYHGARIPVSPLFPQIRVSAPPQKLSWSVPLLTQKTVPWLSEGPANPSLLEGSAQPCEVLRVRVHHSPVSLEPCLGPPRTRGQNRIGRSVPSGHVHIHIHTYMLCVYETHTPKFRSLRGFATNSHYSNIKGLYKIYTGKNKNGPYKGDSDVRRKHEQKTW